MSFLIKWFNDTIGNEGLYALAKNSGKWEIRVEVIIGYAKNEKNVVFFRSKVRGKIVKPKGRGGFGFDPIFMPLGSKKTLAELKNAGNFNYSARGLAVSKLKKYLLNEGVHKAGKYVSPTNNKIGRYLHTI